MSGRRYSPNHALRAICLLLIMLTQAEGSSPMADNEEFETETIPTTEDGIPLFVNGRQLGEVEIQALREARERRAKIDARADLPKELKGADRKSEPTRYLDWELKGRAVDFS